MLGHGAGARQGAAPARASLPPCAQAR